MCSLENPLGFTRETGSLLTGLGCTNLSQFKKRDIGIDDLKNLTDEDLRVLDVGDKFDYKSFHKLSCNLKKKHGTINKPEVADVLKMLGVIQRQLQVVHVYCKCIAKLSPSITDYFIEKNENLRVSQALLTATDSVLGEINCLEEALDDFKINEEIKPFNEGSKTRNVKKCFVFGSLSVGILATIVYFYH